MSFRFTYWRVCSFLVLGAMLLSMLPVQLAHAALQMNASAQAVNDTLQKANWMANKKGPKRIEDLFFSNVLQEMYKDNPNLSADESLQKLQKLRQAYERQVTLGQDRRYSELKSDEEKLMLLFDIVGIIPNATVSKVVREGYKALTKPIWKEWDNVNQILATKEQFTKSEAIRPLQESILQGALDLAKTNNNFAKTFDMVLGGDLNVSITDDAKTVIENNPVLKSFEVVAQLEKVIAQNGSLAISLDELKRITEKEFQKLNSVMGEATDLLKKIDAKQDVLIDWIHNEDDRRAAEAAAAALLAIHQLTVEAAKSGVYLLSTFIGIIDPKLGNMVAVAGNAVIQVAESIDSYMKAAATLGKISDVVGSLGGVILTGNVVAAALSIISLFVDSGPTPEQIILSEIGVLKDQIASLHADMTNRFDRVDLALNKIYETLNDRFNQIDYKLGVIHGNVKDIQLELVNIQQTLQRMNHRTLDLIRATADAPLHLEINGSLNYKERTKVDMPYQPTFVDAEAFFYTWATILAKDASHAGPFGGRSYDDRDVYDELYSDNFHQLTFDDTINYLAAYLNTKKPVWGIETFSNTTLANPVYWAIASRAYVQLMSEWPEYTSRITRGDAMYKTGIDLQSALRNITLRDGTEGPKANYALFNALITNYNDKSSKLDQAIHSIEMRYMDENKIAREPLVNLWGGAGQPPTYIHSEDIPSISSIPSCRRGAGPDLAGPGNIISLMFPNPSLLSHYLQLGAVDLCYTAHWVDRRTVCIHNCDRQGVNVNYGRLEIDIDANYSGQKLHTRFIKTPEEILSEYTSAHPYEEASRRWEQVKNLKAVFETRSQEIAPTNEQTNLLNSVIAQVDAKLREHQKNMYGRILSESAATGSLRIANQELNGATALLEALITLGMPRTLEADDYLRSFLYGTQRIPDSGYVINEYGIAVTPVPPTNQPPLPSINMRERLISLMKQRSDALKDALSGILAQIEQQKQDESQRLVETTLYSLNILNSIKPPVSSSLPFAPIPPFKDSPSRRYFPPTQHSLGGSFLTFWQRNGELAVFGYSLSEEFNEVNQDLRQSFITQYFERQRFEFHPDNAPRYQILLGRLGDELLRNQGRNWRDEDGTSNPFPATTCQVFAIESEQRSVCGPFLQYWRTHGLSLDNKRSISFDESLALFGLPLTAPKMETNPDGGQVLTQWFERARFEYHPNNPVAYQVLLGRLGSEVAKLRMAQTP